MHLLRETIIIIIDMAAIWTKSKTQGMVRAKSRFSNLNLSIIVFSEGHKVVTIHIWCSKAFSQLRNRLTMLHCKLPMVVGLRLGTATRGLSMHTLTRRCHPCPMRTTCRSLCLIASTRASQERQLVWLARTEAMQETEAKCTTPRRITLRWGH